MTTVGEISVKISADLAPLRKAQMDAKKIMGEMDNALNNSAKTISGAFGQTWGAQVSQFNAGAAQVNTNLNKVSKQMGQTAQAANGYARNITSAGQFSMLAGMQFNDLAVQLASGQSAFIAITQQGAQLVQMFEPGTGLGAAAKGLGQAFVQFLTNPLNLALVAMASVAAAVPMIWNAFSGPEETKADQTLKKHIDFLSELEKGYAIAAQRGREYMEVVQNMPSSFAGARGMSAIEEAQKQLENLKVMAGSFRLDLFNRETFTYDFGEAGSQLGNLLRNLVDGNIEASEFQQRLGEIQLRDDLDPKLRSIVVALQENAIAVSEAEAKVRAYQESLDLLNARSIEEVNQEMLALQQQMAETGLTYEDYLSRIVSDNLVRDAVYQQEQAFSELQTAIESLDPGPAKDALQEIYDEAKNGETTAEGFRTAIESLGFSFDNLGAISAIQGIASAAASAMATLNALRASSVMPDLGTLSPIYSFGGKMTTDQQAYQNYVAENTKSQFQIEQEKIAKRDSRGGKAAANKAAKNTSFLENIRAENMELEKQLQIMSMGSAQQEQMMVQLEKEKFIREGLKKLNETATPEMRKMYEEQLSKQFELNQAIEKQKKIQNEIRDLGKSVLSGFISDLRQGKSAAEALEGALDKILDKLLDMALDGIFSGGGGLFGGGGGGLGGIFGSLFGGAGQFGIASAGGIGLYADGGRISGPGTGRSDSIPIMASNGEFMVNAASTSKYLPLLEAINDNRPLGMFADGGMIRVPNSSIRSSGSSGSNSPVQVNIINNSEAKVSQTERKTSGGLVLDVLVDDIVSKNINKPGSGSRSAMQSQFGLGNQLARR